MLSNATPTNLLFLSAGRRVALVKEFKNILDGPEFSGNIVTVDMSPIVPSLYVSDKCYLVPRSDSPDFIEKLIKICVKEKITAVIPLIDPDILILDANRRQIEAIGTKIIVSKKEVLKLCNNKTKTFEFFNEVGILTPSVLSLDEAIENIEDGNILFIKPIDGSSSKNVFKINSLNELFFFNEYVSNPMIQEYIKGIEYTMDIFSDFEGNVISVVPRIRLETRGGESIKGKTIRDEKLIKLSKMIVGKLGIIGPSTLQCLKTIDGDYYFIEINPRFGGGVTLGIKAGANSPKYLIKLLNNIPLTPMHEYNENLIMMRYDAGIYIDETKLIGANSQND